MPTDLKISQLNNGNPAQGSDLLPIDRSGTNFAVTAASIAALAQASALSLFNNIHGWTVDLGVSQVVNYGDGLAAPNIGTSVYTPASPGHPAKLHQTSQAVGGGQATLMSSFSVTPTLNLNGLAFWKMRCALATVAASDEWYVGMTDVNLQTTYIQTSPTTQNVCAFRYIGGATNWGACCCDGTGASTIVDTGIPYDANMHTFVIIPNSNGSSIQFFIDGVLAATINTHVPTANIGSNLSLKSNGHVQEFEYMWYGYND